MKINEIISKIFNCKLLSLSIIDKDDLQIEIIFQKANSDIGIKVFFTEVSEFYFNSPYDGLGYFADIKYFEEDDLHYLSMDPDQSTKAKSQSDNNIVLFKKINILDDTTKVQVIS